MSADTNLVYLASYPKSGNTWLRIFLGYLIHGKKFDMNSLGDFSKITSSKKLFTDILGENLSELTPYEISYYRPIVLKQFANNEPQITFYKTHESYSKNAFGKWLLPQNQFVKTVYLIRNPLDVCVSYTHHSGHEDYTKTARKMGINNYTTKGGDEQFSQIINSWSNHYLSWKDNFPNDKLLCIKYEYMVTHTVNTFTDIVNFIGMNYSTEEIITALELCEFSKLKKQEEADGFVGKLSAAKSFFRKGKIGSWREELTNNQVKRIIKDQYLVMKQYQYID
jgi:hypothetical protein